MISSGIVGSADWEESRRIGIICVALSIGTLYLSIYYLFSSSSSLCLSIRKALKTQQYSGFFLSFFCSLPCLFHCLTHSLPPVTLCNVIILLQCLPSKTNVQFNDHSFHLVFCTRVIFQISKSMGKYGFETLISTHEWTRFIIVSTHMSIEPNLKLLEFIFALDMALTEWMFA